MSTKPVSIARKHLAIFDVHAPHNIKLDGVLKFTKDYAPTEFIIGGDFLNFEWASHWSEGVFATIGLEKLQTMLQQEVAAGRKVLEQFEEVLPKDCKKYYVLGNHENFYFWAALKYPQLAGGVNLHVDKMTFKSDIAKIEKEVLAEMIGGLLKTDELGYKMPPYCQELTLGKLTYVHGHNASSLPALQKQYPATNAVMGHHHTHQVLTTHSGGSGKNANQYVMVPALCGLCPGYLKSSSTRWLNGLWIADVLSNGLFDGKVIKVLDGKIAYAGKVYQ